MQQNPNNNRRYHNQRPNNHRRDHRINSNNNNNQNIALIARNTDNNNHNNESEAQKPIRDNKTRGQYMIGYNRLKEMLANYAKNPDLLLLTLDKEKSLLKLVVNDDRLKGKFGDYSLLCLIIEIFAIICNSDPHLLIKFMAQLCDTSFHQPILTYLTRFPYFISCTQPAIARNRAQHIDTFTNLVTFVRKIQLVMPQSSREKIQLMLLSLSHAMESCNKKEDIIKQSTVDLLNTIKAENENAFNSNSLDDDKAAKAEKMHAISEPPNSFRDISICPTYDDIHVTGRPFLRVNLIKGKYLDVDHYLDVQFRLLREDYVRPLREGIASYLNAIKEDKAVRLKDIRVYSNVRIISSQLKDGLVFEARFDVTHLKNVRWQISDRLLPGSLLCLSYNNFETFCFATVMPPRNADKLAKGLVMIKFETQSTDDEFNKINPLLSLSMVESQAYFEAYRHNLQALQSFNSENFPLQDYIIRVSNVIENLPYLSQATVYDLTDLAYSLIKISSDEFVAVKDTHNALYSNDDKITLFDTYKTSLVVDHNKLKHLERVRVLGDSSWPDIHKLGFDDSQYQAFRAALTKQMVIIQGPPGTGKTYIGLRIVQTLLRNSKHWNGVYNGNELVDEQLFQQTNHRPILIVCYTNHALDQFLEGMVPFCNEKRGIVRIGGRCKSELLTPYTLFSLKQKVKRDRVIPEVLFYSIIQSRRELEMFQQTLLRLQANLGQFIKRLLNESEVSAMSRQYEWINVLMDHLRTFYGRDMNSALINWLSERSAGVNVEVVNVNQELAQDDDEDDMDEDELQEILDTRIIDNDDDSDYGTASVYNGDREVIIDENGDYLEDGYDDGYTVVISRKEREMFLKLMEHELKSNNKMTDAEIYQTFYRVGNISHLSHSDRWRLYRRLVGICAESIQKEIESLHQKYSNVMSKYNRLKLEEDLCVIRGCDVIGMTTTGAAKYRSIIEQIDPSVVVIEEAAEVLESHVITSLTKSTNHLILIGDHRQLKPNPNVYELAKKYNLDISLFERMINNGMPYYQLKLQHRMRPCISSLLVPHIYKELRDHESVNDYEHILGVSKDMYFLNHNESEGDYKESKSKFNDFEAKFVVYLCKYLVQQQYKPTQITIIVMYSAQLFKVKTLMKEHQSLLSGVRVTAVDNYQGEENDIIILSFVRSNIEGSIGFLKVSNRVNVALSRAKMGLYGVGNFDCLADPVRSPLWTAIKKDLEEQQAIGSQLEIYCQNHRSTIHHISKASDFLQVPEGGCNEPCDYRLNCGHVCPRACHVYDREHSTVKCTKICSVPYENCAHKCKSTCHNPKPCAPCKVGVFKTIPTCGHQMRMYCSDDPSRVKCMERCARVLTCGHKCNSMCGNVCNPLDCKEDVKIQSQCGHMVITRCSQRNNNEKLLSICTENCGAVLKCGHLCGGSCGQCQQSRLHVKCAMKCERVLVCGHLCKTVCGDNCPPCREKCQNRCYHSKCNRKCGEPCPPCREPCQWKCDHEKCTRNCSEKCDRQLCNKPCAKKLKCGHNCIGICGERCPQKCRICDKSEVEEIFFGDEDEPNARFVQLADCSHVLELNGMITWMSMSESNADRSNASSNSAIQMKHCPKCKTIIRRTKLFNSPIQEAIKDIELVKVKLFGEFFENERMRNLIVKEMEDYFENEIIASNSENKSQLKNKAQNLFGVTKSNQKKSKIELILIQTKFDIIKKLTKISEDLWKYKYQRQHNQDLADINILIKHVYWRIEKFLKYIDSLVNNDQQKHDSQNELQFIHLSSEIIKVSCDRVYCNEEAKRSLVSAFNLLQRFGPFGVEKRTAVKELVEKAIKLQSGLGISLEEKEMIVEAMKKDIGSSQGHWFKCPNGHIYAIGECGGAMQASKCPECKATIGGGSHQLAAGNALAGEMDGASRPAYGPHVEFNWQQWMDYM